MGRLPSYIKRWMREGLPQAGSACPHGNCCTSCCYLCLNARRKIEQERKRRKEYKHRRRLRANRAGQQARHVYRAWAKGRACY